MITIFTIPKPFNHKTKVIQNNAIQSWKLLTDNILLFGDDLGIAKVAKHYKINNITKVKKNSFGTPILSDVFDQAYNYAKYCTLAYVNCDVILDIDFIKAIKKIKLNKYFLVAKRRNIDIGFSIDFKKNWKKKLNYLLIKQNRFKPVGNSSEFFVFPNNVKFNMPLFAIGRLYWDSWLIYKAKLSKIPVIDATNSIVYFHQIHDYSHHKQGFEGVWHGEEAKNNFNLSGGNKTRFKVTDADYLLTDMGIEKPILTFRSLVRSIRVKGIINPKLNFVYFPLYLFTLVLFKVLMIIKTIPKLDVARISETLKNPGLLEYKFKEL